MSTLGQINVTQALRNAIFNSEPSGSPTNVILNYEKICEKNREKLNQLFETLSYHRVLMDNHNFKFIELRDVWLSSQHGAYLMSSVKNSSSWKEKIEHLCASKMIRNDQQFKILVLSGTHGKKNPDGTISVSGFSDMTLLDESLYSSDKVTAKFLENKMQTDGFKICINVADMRAFSKPLGPELDLCEFVNKENPNMVVMAWCYSTNGNFFQHL
jgi:hypothetical protein